MRIDVRSLNGPPPSAAFKRTVGYQVALTRLKHFHIVEERFTPAFNYDLNFIRRIPAVVKFAGVRNQRPGSLVGFIAVGPV